MSYDVNIHVSLQLFSFSRMLDLITAVCPVLGPTFGDPADVPVLMQTIYCRGSEYDLNDCSYNLAATNETCQTGAGVVCVKRKYTVLKQTTEYIILL